MYDFDTVLFRDNTGSEKWDNAAGQGFPSGVVPLSVADMEFRCAPEIIQALRRTAENGLWGYTHGDLRLHAAAAGWMARRHGWQAQPEWIVNTAGVVAAMNAAVRCFTSPGDRVLIQPPVYQPFSGVVSGNGRVVLENPLRRTGGGRYEMDWEDLRRKAPLARMMFLCSPHNPAGRVWSREELRQVAEICYENRVLLFADEIHGDIILPGHRFVPFGTLEEKYQSNVLVGTSASKTFSLAGLGCSSIFIPETGLRQAFEAQLARDTAQFNSTFGYAATLSAYEQAEPWLDALLPYIQGNNELLRDFLQRHIPAARLTPLEGTYLAWVDFSALGLDDAALDIFLQKEAGLYLSRGSWFGTGGSGFARINLACPRSVLQGALERLHAALKKNRRLCAFAAE